MADAHPLKQKLHHHTPSWVPAGTTFHIRIRCAAQSNPLKPPALTELAIARALLDSVLFYHTRQRWSCHLFLLMPDHLHALLSFPPSEAMSRVIGDWKHYHTAQHKITWLDGYFDHRIRNAAEFELKAHYIRQNPVVKNLCSTAADWPWSFEP